MQQSSSSERAQSDCRADVLAARLSLCFFQRFFRAWVLGDGILGGRFLASPWSALKFDANDALAPASSGRGRRCAEGGLNSQKFARGAP